MLTIPRVLFVLVMTWFAVSWFKMFAIELGVTP
jgi:hypothetical protein